MKVPGKTVLEHCQLKNGLAAAAVFGVVLKRKTVHYVRGHFLVTHHSPHLKLSQHTLTFNFVWLHARRLFRSIYRYYLPIP